MVYPKFNQTFHTNLALSQMIQISYFNKNNNIREEERDKKASSLNKVFDANHTLTNPQTVSMMRSRAYFPGGGE